MEGSDKYTAYTLVRGVTLQCLGHISAGRVVRCRVLDGCASSPDISLTSGGRSQAEILFGGVRFIAWRLGRSAKGNPDGARGIFGTGEQLSSLANNSADAASQHGISYYQRRSKLPEPQQPTSQQSSSGCSWNTW